MVIVRSDSEISVWILAILGPNLVQNWAFGLYLDFDSHDLVEIAYSDCFQWYLVTNDDIKEWFLNFGPNLGHFGPKFDPRLCFCLISWLARFNLNCTFRLLWYLVYTNDDIKEWFLNFGPNLCHFRPKFGPKLGFWLMSFTKTICLELHILIAFDI